LAVWAWRCGLGGVGLAVWAWRSGLGGAGWRRRVGGVSWRCRPDGSKIRRRNSLPLKNFREGGGGFSGDFHTRNDLAHLGWRSLNWQSRAWRSVLAEWCWRSGVGGAVLAEWCWRSGVGGVVLAEWCWRSGVGGVVLAERAGAVSWRRWPHGPSIRRRNSLPVRDFREGGGGFSGDFHTRNDLAHLGWRSLNWQSRAWRSELAEQAWRSAVVGVGLTGRAFGDVTLFR